MSQMANFGLDKMENIVGEEENAGYQHLLLFPQCFQKAISLELLKVGIFWERVKSIIYLFGSEKVKSQIGEIQDHTAFL